MHQGAMATLSGTSEITESISEVDENMGRLKMMKTGQRYFIEEDINRLFEAIEIRNSRRGLNKPEEQGSKELLHKSAMKRPMKACSSPSSGIGISEPVSLKQAFRGLCISQASEMAALKKKLSRPSGFSGVLETVDKHKGKIVQITLVPDKIPEIEELPEVQNSSYSACSPVFGNATGQEAESSVTVSENSKRSKLPESHAMLPVVDEIVPDRGQEGKSSYKSSIKPSFRNKTFAKKKAASSSSSSSHSKPKLASKNENKKKSGKSTPSHSANTAMESSSSSSVGSSVTKTRNVITRPDEKLRSREKGEISQSSKSSIGDYSSTTSLSEESYISGSNRSGYRPHMSKDLRWEAIRCVEKQHGNISLKHFKLLRKLGGGDIGSVYLAELLNTNCLFAVKIMDNEFLASKKKTVRAQTEREILQMLDHPFLPTLYAHFTTDKFSCLLMEYCPGGDLHVLRQKQLSKSFSEHAVRFYVAEVLLALEYLHMLGVVYRDLKPENILVREDGHIMLSDFDLSLRCSANLKLLKSSSPTIEPPKKIPSSHSESSCIEPFCLHPSWQVSCFTPRFLSAAAKTRKLKMDLAAQVTPLPQLVVEPTTARSNSFVGTHEYLAPEIIRGQGHGSAVDWWTFGIFMFELLYGRTPFKGTTNQETLSNVVSQCLKFPENPMISCHARDLIGRLLQKEPENRLGCSKGATDIKNHSFFEGLNWALIRCATPPEMPRIFDLGIGNLVSDTISQRKQGRKCRKDAMSGEEHIEFEMF